MHTWMATSSDGGLVSGTLLPSSAALSRSRYHSLSVASKQVVILYAESLTRADAPVERTAPPAVEDRTIGWERIHNAQDRQAAAGLVGPIEYSRATGIATFAGDQEALGA